MYGCGPRLPKLAFRIARGSARFVRFSFRRTSAITFGLSTRRRSPSSASDVDFGVSWSRRDLQRWSGPTRLRPIPSPPRAMHPPLRRRSRNSHRSESPQSLWRSMAIEPRRSTRQSQTRMRSTGGDRVGRGSATQGGFLWRALQWTTPTQRDRLRHASRQACWSGENDLRRAGSQTGGSSPEAQGGASSRAKGCMTNRFTLQRKAA